MTTDVHSHIYLPRYARLLRERKELPRIACREDRETLLLYPEETEGGGSGGRVIDADFWSVEQKLMYMETHGIDVSVISLGNPWLDFLDPEDANAWARRLNQDLDEICAVYPDRLYGLGVLPLQDITQSIVVLDQIAGLKQIKGAIIGTRGAGKGLDDPALNPVWERAEILRLPMLVHPHYGIGMDHFGEFRIGLNFGLGFPFETSIAVARLVLSGVMERFPDLKLMVAHAGGTLPYLSGRLDGSAGIYMAPGSKLKHPPSEYLRRLYYDALAYHGPALSCVLPFAGSQRIVFGTDHPFKKDPRAAYSSLEAVNKKDKAAILEENARRLFNLE